MIIRDAELSDVPDLARLGALFHAESGLADLIEYVEADYAAWLSAVIGLPNVLMLVADDGEIKGATGGMVCPIYFNAAHITGEELFFWVHPDSRGSLGLRLIEALESAARDAGCSSWHMKALAGVKPEATGRFYERRGYRPAENSYIKRL